MKNKLTIKKFMVNKLKKTISRYFTSTYFFFVKFNELIVYWNIAYGPVIFPYLYY